MNNLMDHKIAAVYQAEHSECGLAVASCILKYFGSKKDISMLRIEYGTPKGGLSIGNILEILDSQGISYRGVRVRNIEDLKGIKEPRVLHWDGNHFVVLYRCRFGRYFVMDPRVGKITYSKSEIQEHFSSVALIPVEKDQQGENNIESNLDGRIEPANGIWNLLRKLVVKSKANITGAILMMLLVKLLTLIVPVASQVFIDDYATSATMPISTMIALLALLGISYYVFNLVNGILLTKLQIAWTNSISEGFMESIFEKPLHYFVNRSSGAILYKSSLIPSIQRALSTGAITNAVEVIFVAVYFILMASYSLRLTIAVGIISILVLVCSVVYSKWNYTINGRVLELQSRTQQVSAEAFAGMETVLALGVNQYFFNKWAKRFEKSQQALSQQGKAAAVLTGLSSTFLFILPATILIFGINEVQTNSMTIGEVVAFIALAGYLSTPLSKLIDSVSQIVLVRSYLHQLSDVTDGKEKDDELTPGQSFGAFERVEGSRVCFRFSKFERNVLDEICFEIKQGEKVAIVGMSGSGKSTFLRLISGLFSPTSGTVCYNGASLSSFEERDLRKKICYVPQNPVVFGDSLYENLHLDDCTLDKSCINLVLEATGVDQIAQESYAGLNAIISENGMNLSGGQIQRVAIARCLLRNPDLIILDEPTSSLDSISEKKIIDYIESSGKTLVIAAHRLNTIQGMDRVIVLDSGKIIECGTHEELLKKKGLYYRLFKGEPNDCG